MADVLYYVIPCYNEEEVLPETSRRLKEKMSALIAGGLIDKRSRVCYVNDGSKDRTWEIIQDLHAGDPLFSGINLTRNRGHQNALLAGLLTVMEFADLVISMDADLQDDIEVCDEMIRRYYDGCDIVYGVRSSRQTDSWFKRITGEGFYKVMGLLGVDLVYNHADYRLMSRRALEGLAEFGEVNLFLRGMVPMVGFPSDVVYYERAERFAGESKYPLKKMIAFAVDGITSLSIRPIRCITLLGVVLFLVSIGMMIYSVVRYYMGATVAGWTFLNVSVWMIGGLILFSLGVIGEYIGKIYLETKRRPRFLIESFVDEDHGFDTRRRRNEIVKSDLSGEKAQSRHGKSKADKKDHKKYDKEKFPDGKDSKEKKSKKK